MLCRHPGLPPDQLADLLHPEAHEGWIPVDEAPAPADPPANPSDGKDKE